jgi:flavin reductase (DIM6/NTAB) family NADH-FMN oxidoreductase RutF
MRRKILCHSARSIDNARMELDLLNEYADKAYPILAALVTPRPIAWVTTLNENGTVNAAPFSFFNVMGDDPPMLVFAPGNREDGTPKDTALNCRRSGEFVVNMVDEALGEAMVRTSASLPYGESETTFAGLTTVASTSVSVPRLEAAPAALECKVHDIIEIGGNRMVIGLILKVQVQDRYFDPATRRIIIDNYHPIGRMAVPDWYCRTNDQYVMNRPR